VLKEDSAKMQIVEVLRAATSWNQVMGRWTITKLPSKRKTFVNFLGVGLMPKPSLRVKANNTSAEEKVSYLAWIKVDPRLSSSFDARLKSLGGSRVMVLVETYEPDAKRVQIIPVINPSSGPLIIRTEFLETNDPYLNLLF